jgi:hypothetical protein
VVRPRGREAISNGVRNQYSISLRSLTYGACARQGPDIAVYLSTSYTILVTETAVQAVADATAYYLRDLLLAWRDGRGRSPRTVGGRR